MISVILNWLYITVTCYLTGFGVIKALSGILTKTKKFRLNDEIDYLYAGIGAVTVYAQFYSIFDGVGAGANLGMLLICVLCIIVYRKELAEKLQQKFGKTISYGIGVNMGDAVVGNIGCEFRMDYTAIGDTVNTAARLESRAKAGEILISEAVYHEVESRITAEPVGEMELKGKSKPVKVYRLIDIKES